MSRFSVGVSLIFILGCGAISSSASAAYSLEDKLKELESRLETKINLLESKNSELEEKVTQLGAQLERNNESRDELALQVAELKTKVQEQEIVVSALLREKNKWKAAPTDSDILIRTNQSPVVINGFPSSCADLKSIGHIWSGFYSVMGNTTMESVYCDFTKLPSDAGFQKWIGYLDIKSAPVHFYVYRTSKFNTYGIPIAFEKTRLNIGNAMDPASGIFTAPRSGIYFFSFMGQVVFPASSSPDGVSFEVVLYQTLPPTSVMLVGLIGVTETNTIGKHKSLVSLQTTLYVKAGEEVYLAISDMYPGSYLNGDDGYPRTFFTGFLLEEEIVTSL